MSGIKLTTKQQTLVTELCEVHNLDASQISFHEKEDTPIFDYEAVNALSLRLTDIQEIKAKIIKRGEDFAKVECIVILPDGRTRSIEETAYLNEPIGGNKTIESLRLAEQVAQARAVRRGVRAVGVNLYKAHKKFMETGEVAQGHTNNDPRYCQYQEIKVLAKKLGLIFFEKNGDEKVENREAYESLLMQNYEVKSLTELDDMQLQRCKILFRSLDRSGYGKTSKVAA